jgi:N-formylglutamate amidohydrolase
MKDHEVIIGYTGGDIVATFGQPRTQRVHALQLEINAALLMTTSRDEFIAHISRGGIPEKADENIGRLRACLQEILPALTASLDILHPS